MAAFSKGHRFRYRVAMLAPGDPLFDEMLELAHLATSASLDELQRSRWRSLCTGLMGELQTMHGTFSPDSGDNRRRAVRGTTSLQVSVLWPDHLSGAAVTSTVSAGGMSLRAEQPVPVGSTLEMSITIPERRVPLFIAAKVVWSRADEVGVAFIDEMPDFDRDVLEAVAIKALLVYAALE
jgi:hypothetical protein